ncbi:MAG TPA: VCBS repeat-containing protein [Candidatus Dormibacteraeota bacterium]|nr:VCBS repeat-containing protein [Candidatus Dormibacteraeota bacterium]
MDNLAPGRNSNSVSVLLGNGDGTFQPTLNFPVGTGPFSLAVADFNGDKVLA